MSRVISDLCHIMGASGLPQYSRHLIDDFESLKWISCRAGIAWGVVAGGVFDDEVGAVDVVAEVSDFVEVSVSGAVSGENRRRPRRL